LFSLGHGLARQTGAQRQPGIGIEEPGWTGLANRHTRASRKVQALGFVGALAPVQAATTEIPWLQQPDLDAAHPALHPASNHF
jgi:hypothetical protein